MNRSNKELFFGGAEDEVAVITLNDADGEAVEIEILANVEIEEYDKEYIAARPRKATAKYPANNLIILAYSEDEEGNPQFGGVSDPQELKEVSDLFMEYFSS